MRVQKLLLGAGILLATTNPALARDVVIHAGTLIDGVTSAPRQRVSIVIKDELPPVPHGQRSRPAQGNMKVRPN